MQAWGATSVKPRAFQQQEGGEKVKSYGKGRQVSGRPNKCSLLSQKTAEELEAQPEMNIESTLHIETLKLGSKGSGDSVLVLMHVTYLSHLLCAYIQLTSTFLHAHASPQIIAQD